MRLPQSITQSLSVRVFHFLTIGMAIALVGLVPVNAGAATPQLTCSPAFLRFGDIVVGQTGGLLVSVTNSGQTSVTVSAITVSNSEFAPPSLSLPLVLLAGQSVDLTVSFTPTTIGWTHGTIQFSSNASNPTLTLDVRGTGVSGEPASASPSTVPFGDVAVGSSSTLPVALKNNSQRSLTVSALQAMATDSLRARRHCPSLSRRDKALP